MHGHIMHGHQQLNEKASSVFVWHPAPSHMMQHSVEQSTQAVKIPRTKIALAGGEILASRGIREAYEHGKGPIIVRGLAFIEGGDAVASTSAAVTAPKRGKKGAREKVLKPSIVITELPYQTNKASFVASVAALVEEQKLTGAPTLPSFRERCHISC